MNFRALMLLGLCSIVGACATTPPDNTTTFEFEGSSVRVETLEVGAGKYKLTLAGARQTKAQVERAYAYRAGQLCGGRGVAGDPEFIPPTNRSTPVLWPGLSSGAYTLAGVVTCPDGAAPAGAAVALVRDSARFTSERKADFFFVSKVGDRKIEDSYTRTGQRNAGNGSYMTPVLVERNVPAQLATFTIVGRARYAAPILEMTSNQRLLDVTGTVTFAPEQHRTYVVKGELGERYSAVWVEEQLDGGGSRMIGKKVEQRKPE
jgi:hypothetical protein